MRELGRILMWWVVLSVWLGLLCGATYALVRWLTRSATEGETPTTETQWHEAGTDGTCATCAYLLRQYELAEALTLERLDRQLEETLAEHKELQDV